MKALNQRGLNHTSESENTWSIQRPFVFLLVFHILGSFRIALIKFSVLTVMCIEFCSIFNINTENDL